MLSARAEVRPPALEPSAPVRPPTNLRTPGQNCSAVSPAPPPLSHRVPGLWSQAPGTPAYGAPPKPGRDGHPGPQLPRDPGHSRTKPHSKTTKGRAFAGHQRRGTCTTRPRGVALAVAFSKTHVHCVEHELGFLGRRCGQESSLGSPCTRSWGCPRELVNTACIGQVAPCGDWDRGAHRRDRTARPVRGSRGPREGGGGRLQ